ncbi:MAG TPA: zf-HC2 domain-containing protein [Anaeromyxobacter sp.]|nr:zf-HC2 domain-containing protein [Anaeromyxobacter sp.]
MTDPTLHLTDAQAQRLVDGTLSAAEAPAVERHAAACVECRATVETYRMLAAALEDLEVPELPAGFTEGVLALVERREVALARERRHAAAILGVLAACTAAAFAIAGAAAWAPVFSSGAELLGAAARAVRVASTFVPHVLDALRVQIIVVAAAAAVPFLLALSRLMPQPQRIDVA